MFKSKRGQLSLADAPTVVLLVGLVFLIMATIAFIGEKYGESMPSSFTATSINETVTEAARNTGLGYHLANTSLCNAEGYAITQVLAVGYTDAVITSNNYSVSSTGYLTNKTGTANNGTWSVTSTTKYAGVGCSVNRDLNTEISNNTSIAGIVLTISLVGIVLTVLIGVFVGMRRRGI